MTLRSTRRASVLALAGAAAAFPWVARAHREAPADMTRVASADIAALPAVALRSMTGEARTLRDALNVDEPLILNFVFTTCSTTCSLQTAVLAQVQREEKARGRPLRLASITIDPDNDTPEQLRRFASQFGVAPGWQFYTGRFDDLLRVQKHFDVYRGSKVSHPPVLLMRWHQRAPWMRVEGFPKPAEIQALVDKLPHGG